MNIKNAAVLHYRLPLLRPMYVRGSYVDNREGVLLVLTDNEDRTGIGEAAPLPYISKENLDEVIVQLRWIAETLTLSDITAERKEVETFCAAFANKYALLPSVRFCFESAMLGLSASIMSLPAARFLTHTAPDTIPVRAMLSHSDTWEPTVISCMQKGFTHYKVKTGIDPVSDLERLNHLRASVGQGISICIDANRRWSLARALEFASGARHISLDYVEEPCDNLQASISFTQSTSIPLAIDESFDSGEILPECLPEDVDVVVLKPSCLCGVFGTLDLAAQAIRQNKRVVISSMFESRIGLSVLAAMSASLNPDEPAGIDTLQWFSGDIVKGSSAEQVAHWDLCLHPHRMSELNQQFLTVIYP